MINERRPEDDILCKQFGCEDRTHPVYHRDTALIPNPETYGGEMFNIGYRAALEDAVSDALSVATEQDVTYEYSCEPGSPYVRFLANDLLSRGVRFVPADALAPSLPEYEQLVAMGCPPAAAQDIVESRVAPSTVNVALLEEEIMSLRESLLNLGLKYEEQRDAFLVLNEAIKKTPLEEWVREELKMAEKVIEHPLSKTRHSRFWKVPITDD